MREEATCIACGFERELGPKDMCGGCEAWHEGNAAGLESSKAEIEKLRKALVDLSSAAYDVVQRNRQIYMGGTKYTTPTIRKLAEAMFEGHKALEACDAWVSKREQCTRPEGHPGDCAHETNA